MKNLIEKDSYLEIHDTKYDNLYSSTIIECCRKLETLQYRIDCLDNDYYFNTVLSNLRFLKNNVVDYGMDGVTEP